MINFITNVISAISTHARAINRGQPGLYAQQGVICAKGASGIMKQLLPACFAKSLRPSLAGGT